MSNADAAKSRADLLERIAHDFSYHAPTPNQIGRYEVLRSTARQMAEAMARNCPLSPELNTAIERLQDAVFWANASIARNESPRKPLSSDGR